MIRILLRRGLGARGADLVTRLLRDHAWPYRWHYGAAFVLMAIVSAMFAAVALLMKDVFNEAFINADPAALNWVALLILVIFTIRGLAMYGQNVILAYVGSKVVAKLQIDIYRHIMHQGLAFHEIEKSGDLSVRITRNCAAAQAALQMIAMRLGVDLMTVLGMVAVMLWTDVTLSLIALFGAPIVFGGLAALIRRVRTLARDEVAMNARILGTLNETITGARVIKAFGLEETMATRAGKAIEGARARTVSISRLSATTQPLMEVVSGIGAAAVLFYAGNRIISGEIDTGSFISFLFAMIALGDPARRLAQLMVGLRQHITGIEFIYETLDTDMSVRTDPTAPELTVPNGAIVFEDVRFAYGDAPALNGLSFEAEGGQITALVGPSGAGKSTVFSLIERFYVPTSGQIRIDGQAIDAVTLASLRQSVAMVTQETFLFDDTIANNIAFGRADASREAIEAAARNANAHDFILAQPRGYDTVVGEGGGALSGGQRQRIAIARAMLRDAPILLLDEATSALDAESEAHIHDALSRLMVGRTTLVIAHRLATIREADKIVVVDKGRVIEEGTHASLGAAGGLYARLAALQFGGEGDRS